MDTERRADVRKDIFRTGTLFFAHGRQCIDCLVWNAGAGGALLEVEDSAEAAPDGRLICEAAYLDCAYQVVWRDGRKLGIVFDI